MTRIVMKFGGTSLAGDRLSASAARVAAAWRTGAQIAVTVSARGDQTDRFYEEALTLCKAPDPRELDRLLATGENQSAALFAMALQSQGCPAVSLSGARAGIVTDSRFGDARITAIDPAPVLNLLAVGKIAVVAGFQGRTPAGEITTLGRGGSDTTASALACAVGADVCRIYTDVDGVYDRDPRTHPDAVKYDRIGYDEMLRLIDNGARVLHRRCVQTAQQCSLPIEVLSSFSDAPGTIVSDESCQFPNQTIANRLIGKIV